MKHRGWIVLVILLALFLAIFIGSYGWYNINYGGRNYYTQITTKGTRFTQKFDDGGTAIQYHYRQPGFDRNGQRLILSFDSVASRPLKRSAYLKVKYNAHRHQVISWEQVGKNQIPAKAANKLN